MKKSNLKHVLFASRAISCGPGKVVWWFFRVRSRCGHPEMKGGGWNSGELLRGRKSDLELKRNQFRVHKNSFSANLSKLLDERVWAFFILIQTYLLLTGELILAAADDCFEAWIAFLAGCLLLNSLLFEMSPPPDVSPVSEVSTWVDSPLSPL